MSEEIPRTMPRDQRLVESTEAMLDYAIIAGAELKNPGFVRLLRLARQSLLQPGEPGAHGNNDSPIPGARP
jgi:hypothetical protein